MTDNYTDKKKELPRVHSGWAVKEQDQYNHPIVHPKLNVDEKKLQHRIKEAIAIIKAFKKTKEPDYTDIEIKSAKEELMRLRKWLQGDNWNVKYNLLEYILERLKILEGKV